MLLLNPESLRFPHLSMVAIALFLKPLYRSAAAANGGPRLLDRSSSFAELAWPRYYYKGLNQCHANRTEMMTRLLMLLAGDLNTFACSNHFVSLCTTIVVFSVDSSQVSQIRDVHGSTNPTQINCPNLNFDASAKIWPKSWFDWFVQLGL